MLPFYLRFTFSTMTSKLFNPLRKNIHKRLSIYSKEYETIQNYLNNNPPNADSLRMKINSIQSFVYLAEKFDTIVSTLKDLEKLESESKDKETKEFIEDELKTITSDLKELEERSIEVLIPKDKHDDCSSITMEIRPGVGGTESAHFSEDLMSMFQNYFGFQGWNYKVTSFTPDGSGKGCKVCIMKISGHEVYKKLKCEAGVHKVIRVPDTERYGRLHSSTAMVIVLPEIPMDFRIDEKDLRYEYMRSSGPGGQHVNKTESACRVTHIPTGLAVMNQEDRHQDKNKKRALEILTSRLFAMEIEKAQESVSSSRKDQMASGDRSDKIRTYNFPQSRITDHRTNFTKYGIERMLNGDFLEEFIEEYQNKLYKRKLEDLLEDLNTKV